jgi:hypothetical protein
MSTIAAAAEMADRIDYRIRGHVIQYCYGTHPSQSQTKFNSARDRRVGLLPLRLLCPGISLYSSTNSKCRNRTF